MRRFFCLTALFLASIGADRAAAAGFCVNNAAEFQQALTTAASNGESDIIGLAVTTFTSPAGGFQGTLEQNTTLTIEGGYLSLLGTCNLHYDDPDLTVIDGAGANRGLRLNGGTGNGGIAISNLTVANGRTFGTGVPANTGAGLKIEGANGFTGAVRVERIIFRGNQADDYGGGMVVAAGTNAVRINNCLFTGNTALHSSGYYVVANGGFVYASNNTFAGNAATSAQTNTATLQHAGSSSAILSNNILWHNTLPTQRDAATAALLMISNNLESQLGNGAIGSVGNTAIDPQFIDEIEYRLKDTSPLLDAGVDNPQGGIPDQDLSGNPRISGAGIDLGAYESTLLFSSGFE
jgi:hypothetical protein